MFSDPVSAIPVYGGIICLRKRAPPGSPAVSFAGLRFHDLGCGKFPISVWLGAQGARMQFTSFLGRCTTSRTRHGEYLFQGEVLGFHYHMMQGSIAEKCSILLIFNTLAKRQVSLGPPDGSHQF